MNRRSTSAISPQSQRAQQQQQLRQRKMQQNAAANPQGNGVRPANPQQSQIDPAAQQAAQNNNSHYVQRVRAQQEQMRRARQLQNEDEAAQAQAFYYEQLRKSQSQGSGFFNKLLTLGSIIVLAYAGYWLHNHHMLDGVYAMFKSSDDVIASTTNAVTADKNVDVSEADLEVIANHIIQSKSTSVEVVNQYLAKWDKLTDSEKRQMMDTVWYQHFSFVVESRIRDYQRRVAFGSKHTSGAEMQKLQHATIPLMKIATAVGIVKKPLEENLSSKQERFKKMMAEVEKDIREQRSEKEHQRDELLQTTKLDSKSIAAPKSQPSNTSSKPTTQSAPANKPKSSATTSPAATSNIQIQHVVTQRDIDDVLSEYKLAYQKGDVTALLDLFQGEKSLNESNRIALLKDNYETSFKLSRQRQIKLSNIKWEQQGSQLFGSGDYKETFKLGSGKDTREINAKLNMELRSKPGQQQGAYIANFTLSDQTVTQIKPEIKVAKSSVQELVSRKKPVAPTAAELQDLVAKFIRVWETGNSKELVSILSSDAKTNDKSSRDAIGKAYSNIFQATYDREMYISNMQWETNGSFAKGRGFLEAMSFSKEDDDIKNLTGKIQIVAHREGNAVKITHLYHLTQEQ